MPGRGSRWGRRSGRGRGRRGGRRLHALHLKRSLVGHRRRAARVLDFFVVVVASGHLEPCHHRAWGGALDVVMPQAIAVRATVGPAARGFQCLALVLDDVVVGQRAAAVVDVILPR